MKIWSLDVFFQSERNGEEFLTTLTKLGYLRLVISWDHLTKRKLDQPKVFIREHPPCRSLDRLRAVAHYPRLVFVGYNPSDLHGISRVDPVNPLITEVITHLRAVG